MTTEVIYHADRHTLLSTIDFPSDAALGPGGGPGGHGGAGDDGAHGADGNDQPPDENHGNFGGDGDGNDNQDQDRGVRSAGSCNGQGAVPSAKQLMLRYGPASLHGRPSRRVPTASWGSMRAEPAGENDNVSETSAQALRELRTEAARSLLQKRLLDSPNGLFPNAAGRR